MAHVKHYQSGRKRKKIDISQSDQKLGQNYKLKLLFQLLTLALSDQMFKFDSKLGRNPLYSLESGGSQSAGNLIGDQFWKADVKLAFRKHKQLEKFRVRFTT